MVVGGTGSGKTNLLFNLIKQIMSDDSTITDKVHLHVKDPDEDKYRNFIKGRKKVREEIGDENAFVETNFCCRGINMSRICR